MPVAAFWLFHRNVDRLLAEKDSRLATVTTHVTTPEGLEKLGESLERTIGEIFVFEVEPEIAAPPVDVYDREGLLALKGMGRMM